MRLWQGSTAGYLRQGSAAAQSDMATQRAKLHTCHAMARPCLPPSIRSPCFANPNRHPNGCPSLAHTSSPAAPARGGLHPFWPPPAAQ